MKDLVECSEDSHPSESEVEFRASQRAEDVLSRVAQS